MPAIIMLLLRNMVNLFGTECRAVAQVQGETMEIEVDVHQADDPIAIMHVKGAINASNFIRVSDKAPEPYMNPAHNLIIDLTDVTSISTAVWCADISGCSLPNPKWKKQSNRQA